MTSKRQSKYLHTFFSLLLTAILIFAISKQEGLSGFYSRARGITLNWLVAYLLLSFAGFFLRALRYHVCFNATEKHHQTVKFRSILITTGIRNALVDFLPARLGEISYFYVLSRYGVSLASSSTVFAICTALDLVILLFIVFTAIVCGFIFNAVVLAKLFKLNALLLGLGFLLAGMIAAEILRRLNSIILGVSRLLKSLKLNPKLVDFTIRIADELKSAKETGRYSYLVFLTFLLRLAKYCSLYCLLISVLQQSGVGWREVSPVITTLAFIVAEASASLPISGFMGFGAYEGSWQLIFSTIDVKINSITSVILLVHIITQVVGYFIALLCAAAFCVDEFILRKRGEI